MVRAKNYETVSTFVKVIQKKLWPLFSGHGVFELYGHCAVCLGSYNVHAGERVILLAHSDGTVQHKHHVGTERHHGFVSRGQHSRQDNLLLSALHQPQHQPGLVLLHWQKVPSGTQGQLPHRCNYFPDNDDDDDDDSVDDAVELQ